MSLPRLICDLEGLLYALELAPEDWKRRFIEEWSTLEISYGVALDRLEPLPTIEDGHVSETVEALEVLVRESRGRRH